MGRFLSAALGFYLVSIALGVVLRFYYLMPIEGLVFGHAIHAHSHTLYFGWAALGILALMYERVGATGRGARAVLWATVAIAIATFVSFLQGGYSLPSIVISSLSLLVWGAAAVVFFRAARGRRGLDVSLYRWGVVYLVIAVCFALSRVLFIALHTGPLAKSLAVFGFLNAFAWFFVLSITGLLVAHARAHRLHLPERALARMLHLVAPVAWLCFPLGVAGEVGPLGVAARGAALVIALGAGTGAMALWRAGSLSPRGEDRRALRWLGLWLGLEATLALGGALGLADVAVRSRHLVVAYLHVLLVGFVTFGLMTVARDRLGVRLGVALWAHNLGLALMLVGLAISGAPALGVEPLPMRLGLVLAAIGGVVILAAGLGWAGAMVRRRLAHRVDAVAAAE